jgi:hypothetical protein
MALSSCAPAEPARVARPAGERPARSFDLVALGGERITSEGTRGRSTLVVVITTYDIPSQYVAREAATVMRSHRPRINAFAVVLEPPRNAPLVEAFGALLGLPYPLVLGDEHLRSDDGPLGGIAGVPTLIVLDRMGREVWRRAGAASARDMEHALSTAESGAGI